jgi:hypothetical protein
MVGRDTRSLGRALKNKRNRHALNGVRHALRKQQEPEGDRVEVQRSFSNKSSCQIHKRRNVREYLPENCRRNSSHASRPCETLTNVASIPISLGIKEAVMNALKHTVVRARCGHEPTRSLGLISDPRIAGDMRRISQHLYCNRPLCRSKGLA